MKYTNKDFDITIIEIKEKDNIKNYLELDENIISSLKNNKDNNNNNDYEDKTLYIIQYPEGELSVSYGILNNTCLDKKYDFNHLCSTNKGSSGSPILNIINNKIIGIHKKSGNKNFNKGTFLNYPIKEFIRLNYNNKNHKSEIINNKLDEDNKIDIKDNNKEKPIMNQMGMSSMNNFNQMGMGNMITFNQIGMDDMNNFNQMGMNNNNFNQIGKFKMNISPMQKNFQTNVSRLLKEFRLCKEDKELKELGCNFVLENNNIYIWRTTMNGAGDTPYEGGIFTIRISFPSDYPNHGPEFKFINKIFHLNVDLRNKGLGDIYIETINEWRSTGKVRDSNFYTVKQALFDIFFYFIIKKLVINANHQWMNYM